MDNVVQLPRPRHLRTGHEPLAFFVRVGRNDHREAMELIAAGERGIFGFVIDALYVDRHKELIIEARKRDFAVILDPKTQQMGFPGSYNESLAGLPWGKSAHHHRPIDFEGQEGKSRASVMVEFAMRYDFTHILGPSHLIGDPNDPWLQRDIAMMTNVAECIQRSGKSLQLVYSLGLPISLLRDDARRSALVASIGKAPCDAIWLKVENFGDDATGEKTVAYLRACRDFHNLGLPLIADHVGGLPGLASLAFGAVGGISHGVTMNQGFTASSWRRPPRHGGGGTERRVYLPQLDLLVRPEVAKQFLTSSQRVRGRHVCRDQHCCPRGLTDMIDRPARHALYQRCREIEGLGGAPKAVRIPQYLEHVRRVSDEVALVAGFDKLDVDLRKRLHAKQKALGHFRDAVAHLASVSKNESVAMPPLRLPNSGNPNK